MVGSSLITEFLCQYHPYIQYGMFISSLVSVLFLDGNYVDVNVEIRFGVIVKLGMRYDLACVH